MPSRPEDNDVATVVSAARGLAMKQRGDRWCHLSLCLIDAVFSIGANYTSTKRVAHRYASHAGLSPVIAPAAVVASGLHWDSEEPLGSFVERVCPLQASDLADILGNRQRTSTRSGILKAEAVQRYARILSEQGLSRLGDAGDLLADPGRTAQVESALAVVPGHGSGVRVSYLWMLFGDDQHVKADRMVTRWISQALARRVGVQESTSLVVAAADRLAVTPWVLDHAIWNAQSGRA